MSGGAYYNFGENKIFAVFEFNNFSTEKICILFEMSVLKWE